MKINGKEITGCGIIETALDGLTAKEFCLCVTYKKDRKNGKGFDTRRTTLPEIVRRNNDLALALPEFIGENMGEGIALETCAKFAKKFDIPMLPIESQRLDELRILAARAKNAAAEKAENDGEIPLIDEEKPKKAKKTATERIAAILEKEYKGSNVAKVNAVFEVLKGIAPAAAEQAADIFRAAMLPECCKETAPAPAPAAK